MAFLMRRWQFWSITPGTSMHFIINLETISENSWIKSFKLSSSHVARKLDSLRSTTCIAAAKWKFIIRFACHKALKNSWHPLCVRRLALSLHLSGMQAISDSWQFSSGNSYEVGQGALSWMGASTLRRTQTHVKYTLGWQNFCAFSSHEVVNDWITGQRKVFLYTYIQ